MGNIYPCYIDYLQLDLLPYFSWMIGIMAHLKVSLLYSIDTLYPKHLDLAKKNSKRLNSHFILKEKVDKTTLRPHQFDQELRIVLHFLSSIVKPDWKVVIYPPH